MGLDPILCWKTRNYPKIILLNLKMVHIIQKSILKAQYFQKAEHSSSEI